MLNAHITPKTRKGFTLVELIVVIVIIGILAVVAFATFSRTIGRAEESTAEQTALSVVRNASAIAAFDRNHVYVEAYGADGDETALDIAIDEVNAGGDKVSPGTITHNTTTGTGSINLTVKDGSATKCVTLNMVPEVNAVPSVASVVKDACTTNP